MDRASASYPADGALSSPPPLERICYRKADLPAVTGIPERTLERAIHRGEFPPPDRRIGRIGIWSRATIERWLQAGGGARS